MIDENPAINKQNRTGLYHAAFWGYSPVIPQPYNRDDLLLKLSDFVSERGPTREFGAAFWETSPVIRMHV
jgi:hypothetical protein